MTRQEFIDEINDFDDLREFAQGNDLYEPIEDLIDEDGIDEEVNYEIEELTRNESWRRVRDILDEIPTYAGWFIRTGYLEYEEAGDYEFQTMKQDVLDAADEDEVWDEEETG